MYTTIRFIYVHKALSRVIIESCKRYKRLY